MTLGRRLWAFSQQDCENGGVPKSTFFLFLLSLFLLAYDVTTYMSYEYNTTTALYYQKLLGGLK